ncbi:MAG TPA: hypothetical protein VFW78_00725 [Bacteroidia bacterium]|nr:hypothetical protein [Bacteroidia bacterium]
MKKAEIILSVCGIAALVMNIFLIPGAGLLTVLTLMTLSVYYFYSGYVIYFSNKLRIFFGKESNQNLNLLQKAATFASGIGLSLVLVGIVFKIQFWSGAKLQLNIGLLLLLLVFIVGLFNYIKTKSDFFISIINRIVLWGGIGLLFALTSDADLVQFKYRNHPALRDAILQALEHPNQSYLWDNVQKERDKMYEEKE